VSMMCVQRAVMQRVASSAGVMLALLAVRSIAARTSSLYAYLFLCSSPWILEEKRDCPQSEYEVKSKRKHIIRNQQFFKDFYSYCALVNLGKLLCRGVCNNFLYSLLFHSLTKDMTGKVFFLNSFKPVL